MEPEIRNSNGEKLDTWVEGESSATKTIIMVHGYGTDKHEHGYFDFMATAFVAAGFRVVRFDFSAYGKSEGKEVDVCYSKQAADLQAEINYVKATFQGDYYLFSQSMGTWVTAILAPSGFAKTIFTGIPNANTDIMINRFKGRAATRPGATFNEQDISTYPRSSGAIQQIGPSFWAEIRKFNPLNSVESFAAKTKLLIIHWYEDEILGTENMAEYDSLENVTSLWFHGDHSVSSQEQKDNLAKVSINYFQDSIK